MKVAPVSVTKIFGHRIAEIALSESWGAFADQALKQVIVNHPLFMHQPNVMNKININFLAEYLVPFINALHY